MGCRVKGDDQTPQRDLASSRAWPVVDEAAAFLLLTTFLAADGGRGLGREIAEVVGKGHHDAVEARRLELAGAPTFGRHALELAGTAHVGELEALCALALEQRVALLLRWPLDMFA